MPAIITGLLIVLLISLTAATVVNYRRRLRSGCCGGSGDPVQRRRRQRSRGDDLPYVSCALIDGMMCSSCAARIENAVNEQPDLLARVDLAQKTLTVRSRAPIEQARIRQLVALAGYRVTSFKA